MTEDSIGGVPTIYQVAARAGVSVTTVSHALNRPDRVADTTRQRVLRVVEDLGFTPRRAARPRTPGRSTSGPQPIGRVAVVAPFALHPSYLERLVGVLTLARDSGLDIVTIDVDTPQAVAATIAAIGDGGRFNAAILMGMEPDPAAIESARASAVPIVLVDRDSTRFTSVGVDDELGGRLVAEHLLQRGATSFGFVSPAPRHAAISSGELRVRGFTDALRAAEIEDEIEWFVTDDGWEGGFAAAADIAGSRVLPDALFALHDLIAAGLIAGLAEQRIAVPDQVLVVGYDDAEIARSTGITSVRQPFRDTGRLALEAIQAALADPAIPIRRLDLIPELIPRSSTTRTSTTRSRQVGTGDTGQGES